MKKMKVIVTTNMHMQVHHIEYKIQRKVGFLLRDLHSCYDHYLILHEKCDVLTQTRTKPENSHTDFAGGRG